MIRLLGAIVAALSLCASASLHAQDLPPTANAAERDGSKRADDPKKSQSDSGQTTPGAATPIKPDAEALNRERQDRERAIAIQEQGLKINQRIADLTKAVVISSSIIGALQVALLFWTGLVSNKNANAATTSAKALKVLHQQWVDTDTFSCTLVPHMRGGRKLVASFESRNSTQLKLILGPIDVYLDEGYKAQIEQSDLLVTKDSRAQQVEFMLGGYSFATAGRRYPLTARIAGRIKFTNAFRDAEESYFCREGPINEGTETAFGMIVTNTDAKRRWEEMASRFDEIHRDTAIREAADAQRRGLQTRGPQIPDK